MFSWSQDLPQCWRLCCATGSPGVPTRQSKSMPDISTMSLGFPAAAPKNPRGIPQVYHCRGMWFGLGFGKLLQRWNPLRNPRFHWHQRIVSLPIRIYIYIYYIYIIFVYAYIHGHMVERCWKHPTKFSFWHGLWCFCRCLDILFLALTVGPNFGLPKMVLFQNLDRGTSFRFRAPQTNGRFIHSKQKMRSFAEVSKKCSETKC